MYNTIKKCHALQVPLPLLLLDTPAVFAQINATIEEPDAPLSSTALASVKCVS